MGVIFVTQFKGNFIGPKCLFKIRSSAEEQIFLAENAILTETRMQHCSRNGFKQTVTALANQICHLNRWHGWY